MKSFARSISNTLPAKCTDSLIFMKANIKNSIYHRVTKSCCHSYILLVFWVERKAWTGRSHPTSTWYPLEVGSYCGEKKNNKPVLHFKSSVECTFAFDKRVWGLMGPWQLRKCAQQPFPLSCSCSISLGGMEAVSRLCLSLLYTSIRFGEAESELREG